MYSLSSYDREIDKLHVPYYFWFNKEIANALPLIALLHTKAYIKVELNNIQIILLQEIKEKFYGKNECGFFPIKYCILSVNSKKRVI